MCTAIEAHQRDHTLSEFHFDKTLITILLVILDATTYGGSYNRKGDVTLLCFGSAHT